MATTTMTDAELDRDSVDMARSEALLEREESRPRRLTAKTARAIAAQHVRSGIPATPGMFPARLRRAYTEAYEAAAR